MDVRQIFEGDCRTVNEFLVDCAKNGWEVLEIKLSLLHFPREDEKEADETLWYSIIFSAPLEEVEG